MAEEAREIRGITMKNKSAPSANAGKNIFLFDENSLDSRLRGNDRSWCSMFYV